jgi:hypothetical protein
LGASSEHRSVERGGIVRCSSICALPWGGRRLEVEIAEWALLQEIGFLRRQLSYAYARVPRVSEDLLAISRQLDRDLLVYQEVFAPWTSSEQLRLDGASSG